MSKGSARRRSERDKSRRAQARRERFLKEKRVWDAVAATAHDPTPETCGIEQREIETLCVRCLKPKLPIDPLSEINVFQYCQCSK